MINLRPHHILCIQGYIGKGYNKEFIKNMDEIVKQLRENSNIFINIIYKEDDICKFCPNRNENNKCKDSYKVKYIDQKVVKYFKLEEKNYKYIDILNEIKENINMDKMKDICSSCSWYKNNYCKDILIKKSNNK